MKKTLYILAAAILFAAGTANGQLARTSYFMEGAPQRLDFNPAFRPFRGFVMIPGIGNFNLGLSSNALAPNNFLYPYDSKTVTIFHESVKWNDIEHFLQQSNNLNMEMSTSIISLGMFAGKRGFWTFDSKVKTEAGVSLPKDLFHFMKGVDSGPQFYDMGGINAGVNAYLTASAGYSYRLFDNLNVGARVNFLGGLAHANVRYDELKVALDTDEWNVNAAGSFTAVGLSGLFGDRLDEATGRTILTTDGEGYNFHGLSGFGMTFDIGGEYEILDRIKVSMSILDIGFMRWNENKAIRATSEAGYSWAEEPSGDFKDFTRFYTQDNVSDIKSKVYATFVVGAEYDVLADDMLRVGAMFMNKKNEFTKRSEFSLTVSSTPIDWFTASLNYVARDYKQIGGSFVSSLGFAVNFHPKWINFFIGTDYVFSTINPQFIPVSQKIANFYMGISVPLAKEKRVKLPKLGI